MSHAATHEFDATDPHHAQSGHGHVVLSWQLLVGVLGALLFLTFLTVFTAQAEKWVMDVWGIVLPGWVNLFGAMSIATVKALLVMAFFMQLKYDKPINSLTMVFCLICVWLFLMFSMLDLGHRNKVQAFKAQTVSEGGTGYSLGNGLSDGTPAIMSARLSPHVNTGNQSLPEFVFEKALANFPDEAERGKKIPEKYFDDPYYTENAERAFWHWYYEYTYVKKGLVPHHHNRDTENYYESFLEQDHAVLVEKGLLPHHGASHEMSDANKSRPRHGLTAGLFSASSHDAHGEASHEDAGHSETTHEEAGHEGAASADTTHDAAPAESHDAGAAHEPPATEEPPASHDR